MIPLALIALAFWVVSFVDCAMQPPTRHRGASKRVWVLVTIIPVIGGLLWWTIGRARTHQIPRGTQPYAPDDAPDSAASSADDRIRKLEEELALLDMEEAFDLPDAERPGRAEPREPDGSENAEATDPTGGADESDTPDAPDDDRK